MDSGEERGGVFSVAGGDAAPSFEHQERVFNPMTEFVECFVVWSLRFSIFLWRDNSVHALRRRLFEDRIRVVPLVGDQVIGIDPLHQAAGLRAIRSGTFCNKDSDRQTRRIHGQMDFGVEPP